jgi:hypothetical protein
MAFLPCVIRADYRGGFRIHLTFNDLSEGTVDFRPWLEGPVFEPLKEPAYFRDFFVEGCKVAWPNGADIAPETLYEAAKHRSIAAAPKRTTRKRPLQATAQTRLKPAKARSHN